MHSFRVDGYFEETKLSGIDIGQRVDIKIMGEPGVLRGHVASIVSAIEDRDRSEGSNLLPNVNPAFSWVRLAQRIPVRVALDDIPKDFRMIAGRTATVSVRGLVPMLGSRGEVDHTAASAAQTGSPASVQAAAVQPAVQPAAQAADHSASQAATQSAASAAK